jgi:hypothetical protein
MMIWRYRYHDESAPSGQVNDYHYESQEQNASVAIEIWKSPFNELR